MSAYFHLYLKMSGSIVHRCSLRNPLLRRTFGEYRYNGHYCMWIESEDHNELKQKIHSSHCESAGKLFSYPSIADMIHDTWFTTLRLRLLFIDNPENLAEVLAFSTLLVAYKKSHSGSKLLKKVSKLAEFIVHKIRESLLHSCILRNSLQF